MRRSWMVSLVLAAALAGAGCWIKDISTPYFTQTTSYYCGAASAKMILDSASLGILVSSQDTLYNYIHAHNTCTSGWASDPGGLAAVLNHYGNSHNPPAYFIHYAPTNQDEGIKKLTYTIDEYGVPPAAMVYGCAHWVVVRGAITSAEPKTAETYTVDGLYVNDPWYGSNSLGENKYVAINSWRSDYFTGCSWCGAAGNTFISVDDPRPVPKRTVLFPAVKPRRAQPIPPEEALAAARDYLAQLDKAPAQKDPAIAEGVRAMRAAQPTAPLLVRRSDRAGEAYYIVPLEQQRLAAGAVLIDAYSGQLEEATYAAKPLPYMEAINPERVRGRIFERLPTLRVRPELRERLAPPPGAAVRQPAAQPVRPGAPPTFRELGITAQEVKLTRLEAVWEPSAESQNPYYPLWRIEGTVRKVTTPQLLGFLGAKGELVHELTPAHALQLKGGGPGGR